MASNIGGLHLVVVVFLIAVVAIVTQVLFLPMVEIFNDNFFELLVLFNADGLFLFRSTQSFLSLEHLSILLGLLDLETSGFLETVFHVDFLLDCWCILVGERVDSAVCDYCNARLCYNKCTRVSMVRFKMQSFQNLLNVLFSLSSITILLQRN